MYMLAFKHMGSTYNIHFEKIQAHALAYTNRKTQYINSQKCKYKDGADLQKHKYKHFQIFLWTGAIL